MASNAEILAMFVLRYPQFATIDAGRFGALIDDARLSVPVCQLGDRADLALMYKAGSLLVSGLLVSADGSSGQVKRKKDMDIEIEYFSGGTSQAQATLSEFERLYQELFKAQAGLSSRFFLTNG